MATSISVQENTAVTNNNMNTKILTGVTSAVCPGAGQVINGQYGKAALIGGGFWGGAALLFVPAFKEGIKELKANKNLSYLQFMSKVFRSAFDTIKAKPIIIAPLAIATVLYYYGIYDAVKNSGSGKEFTV